MDASPTHTDTWLPNNPGCLGPTARGEDPTEQLSGCVFSCHVVLFCFCGLIMGKWAVNMASEEIREGNGLISWFVNIMEDTYLCRVLLAVGICREIPGPVQFSG